MDASVGVIDYGAGNIGSVCRALERVGARPKLVASDAEIRSAGRLILPGVGAAAAALVGLRSAGLDATLDDVVRRGARPMLAICVGMQVLARRLLEFGDHEGLGWVDGTVEAIEGLPPGYRVPHMGWTSITPTQPAGCSFRIPSRAKTFYFAHGYRLRLEGGATCQLASARHGADFTAAIGFGSVVATQFHPEKSQIAGESLIKAFLRWSP